MNQTYTTTLDLQASGAWLVYDYGHEALAIALFMTPNAAAKYQARLGYGRVGYWPYGMELSEAVKKWEEE